MKPQQHDEPASERLAESGFAYYTDLTVDYLEGMPDARIIDTEERSNRNVVWFEFDGVEMSVSIYPTQPAVCIGVDTRIAYDAFQANAAWILRTCADFGVGIDLDVDEKTGDTWMFLFLRIFWAGYNFEVLGAAADDLLQCRKALEARLPIKKKPGKRKKKRKDD